METIFVPKRLVEMQLIDFANKDSENFIKLCEKMYQDRIVNAAKEIIEFGCKIVMLTGPSSSGKTTTSNKLSMAISQMGVPSSVVSLDDFYYNKEKYPLLPNGKKDYENVTALDVSAIHTCLSEIIATGKTNLPQFDFATESRKLQTKALDISTGIVIVEGIHALNPILIKDRKSVV